MQFDQIRIRLYGNMKKKRSCSSSINIEPSVNFVFKKKEKNILERFYLTNARVYNCKLNLFVFHYLFFSD